MKVLKIVLIVIGGIVALVFILFFIYWMANKQGVIESFDVGDPQLAQRVLIASQGSDFKNALVESLTAHLQEQKVFIKVIDVTGLGAVNEDEYEAVVLIHTVEQWKLHPDVKAYLDRTKDLDKIVLVSTSGSGDWKTKDYDVETVTSASKTEEFSTLIPLILERLDAILSEPAPQR